MSTVLDDEVADRLLAGQIAPHDAPAGYGEVATLIRAARAPISATERAATTAPYLAPVVPLAARRRRPLRSVATKAAAIVLVSGLGMGAAAAATGSLPAPAQRTVSDLAGHVGLSLPEPEGRATGIRTGGSSRSGDDATDESTATTAAGATTTRPREARDSSAVPSTTPVGPDLSKGSSALAGICTAYFAGKGNPNGLPFARLEALAAGGAAQAAALSSADLAKAVASYCGVPAPTTPGTSAAPPSSPGRGPGSGPPTSVPKPPKTSSPPPTTGATGGKGANNGNGGAGKGASNGNGAPTTTATTPTTAARGGNGKGGGSTGSGVTNGANAERSNGSAQG